MNQCCLISKQASQENDYCNNKQTLYVGQIFTLSLYATLYTWQIFTSEQFNKPNKNFDKYSINRS